MWKTPFWSFQSLSVCCSTQEWQRYVIYDYGNNWDSSGDPWISLFCSTPFPLTLQCPWTYSDPSEGGVNLIWLLKDLSRSWSPCYSSSVCLPAPLKGNDKGKEQRNLLCLLQFNRKSSLLVSPHVSKYTPLLSGPGCNIKSHSGRGFHSILCRGELSLSM